jgi:hypothetical protein
MLSFGLFSVVALFFVSTAFALSNVTFYADLGCTKFKSWKTGPDDGTCTVFPSDSQGYESFMVTSLDQTCAG